MRTALLNAVALFVMHNSKVVRISVQGFRPIIGRISRIHRANNVLGQTAFLTIRLTNGRVLNVRGTDVVAIF